MSGLKCRPKCPKSSATFTATNKESSARFLSIPKASFAPPTPPDNATIFPVRQVFELVMERGPSLQDEPDRQHSHRPVQLSFRAPGQSAGAPRIDPAPSRRQRRLRRRNPLPLPEAAAPEDLATLAYRATRAYWLHRSRCRP